MTEKLSPMELGTRLHQEIEKVIEAEGELTDSALNALTQQQLTPLEPERVLTGRNPFERNWWSMRSFASTVATDAAIYGKADVLVIHGGDLLQHDVPMPPGDAMMIDKNGDPHWIDYKLAVKDVDFSRIERRVLDHMAVDMAKKIELDIEDTMYGNSKPFRGSRVRDWEQRRK